MPDITKIKNLVRSIPDFPKKGIIFRDITTLLQDYEGLTAVIQEIVHNYKNRGIDIVAGIEARGFIIGGAVAQQLGTGFVPIRKKGKLPYETVCHDYELEYGTDSLELHVDAIKPGMKVLIIDDLIATGGTALASAKLVEKVGGVVASMAFIINLPEVGGEKRLINEGYEVFTLCSFEGH